MIEDKKHYVLKLWFLSWDNLILNIGLGIGNPELFCGFSEIFRGNVLMISCKSQHFPPKCSH
jgi:hypothetical protein